MGSVRLTEHSRWCSGLALVTWPSLCNVILTNNIYTVSTWRTSSKGSQSSRRIFPELLRVSRCAPDGPPWLRDQRWGHRARVTLHVLSAVVPEDRVSEVLASVPDPKPRGQRTLSGAGGRAWPPLARRGLAAGPAVWSAAALPVSGWHVAVAPSMSQFRPLWLNRF